MASEKKSSFVLSLKGNAADEASRTAGSIDELATAIEKSEAAIKDMSADLRRLRGSSAEVKAEKDKLKAAIGSERQEITRSTLEIKKLGGSTQDLANKQKQLATAEKKSADASKRASADRAKQGASIKSALGAIGGPAKSVSDKLETLSSITEGLGSAEGIAAVGAAGVALAVVAVGAAALYGAEQLTQFIVESQSAAREMNLMRAAATGSAENAQHLGEQVDALAKNVPIARTEINKMSIELGRTGLRGQTMVDTMDAVAQATGVGDDALASFAKDLVTRGQQFQRFSLSPAELLGKNLRFDDVAAELAKGMHTSIDDARQALLAGQVPLADGAAALRRAMDRKFAGVNKELMLDPDKQVEKLKESIADLTSGVDIKPLLGDMHEFFDLFDSTKTTTGAAIKQLVTSLGKDLIEGIHEAGPAADDLVRGLVLGALKADNYWLTLKVTIKKAAEEASGAIDKIKNAKLDGFGDLAHVGARVVGAAIPKQNASDIPKSLVNGLMYGGVAGLGLQTLRAGGSLMADAIDTGFKAKAEIHSPSRVMQRNANMLIRGVVDPLKRGEPTIADALGVMMAPMMRITEGATRSSGGGASGPRELHVHFHGVNEKTQRALEQPSIRVALTKLLEDSLRQHGMGVPQ